MTVGVDSTVRAGVGISKIVSFAPSLILSAEDPNIDWVGVGVIFPPRVVAEISLEKLPGAQPFPARTTK